MIGAGTGIGVSAAIQAIKRNKAVRVYAETSALKLLGLEDKYQARFEWKKAHGKIIQPTETATFENVRRELDKRSSAEMEEAREEFRRRNKIWSYFPDEGPLRRELYPRHMEFVGYTKTDDEVMMLAANRCLTPWSPVETDRGERLSSELIGESGFHVQAWDGNSRCTKQASPVFLKGIEPAFQIHLDNGEVFQCSGRHRVLRHASMGGHLYSDWLSIGQIIHVLNGLHLRKTGEDWTASYGGGDRLCDGQPLSVSVASDWPLPRPHDAHRSSQQRSQEDGAASRSQYTHACRVSGRLSIYDERNLIDLFQRSEAPGALGFSVPTTVRDRISRQSLDESALDLRELVVDLWPVLSERPCVDEFLLAFDSPRLFNGRSIVAVVPLGLQPIIDFTVPDTHNYFGSGIVHHNSGKTQLGAICIAHWAMGRYPHWWHGREFPGPTNSWICNKTAKDTRNINEAELLGPVGNEMERGTGMIPAHLIQKVTPKPGTPHAFEFIAVEHVSGMTSYIESKSYDQGREAFQGKTEHAIWNDEEVPKEIAGEQRVRIMTSGGLLIYTYTPVNGLTEMTSDFMESAGMNIDQMRHITDGKEALN